MAKHLFLFYLFLLEMVLGSASSIAPEAYWKIKLPHTPMPQSILNSLAPAPVEQPGRAEESEGVHQSSAKESLASIKAYMGLWFYRQSLRSLNPRYQSYDKQGLDSSNPKYLSYNKQPNKKGLDSNNQKYLSYNNKQGLETNGYDTGLFSYAYRKKSLESNNQKSLSYNKQGLETNGYDTGLFSYAYSKKNLESNNQKPLSYNKQGLETNGYDTGLFSYAYNKKRLDSNNQKSLSNNKQGLETNGYDTGLFSYAYKKKQIESNHALDQDIDSSHVVDDDNSITKDQAIFFVEKDLHLGTTKILHFKKSIDKVMFLPRDISNKIPFQSNKIQETLEILSLDPKSKEAGILSKRIELCEEPTVEGVEKKCVTSLESMVDYVISMLGTNVKALTTQLEKDYSKMDYTFKGVKKLSKDDHETVVCHNLGYPYALFFCHRTTTIRSYLVTLVGKDGSKIEALAACHKESNDVLDNYAKNVLHVVPGSTHICHFPPAEDTIVWVPQN